MVKSGMARWAIGLAAFVAILDVIVSVAFIIAYASNGTAGFSDNWLGALGAIAIYVGLLASLIAFSMAITVKIKHEKWVWIRLPLIVFPALLALLVLGELFWWH